MSRKSLKNSKRIVIKLGTNTLTNKDGSLDLKYLQSIASQVSELKKQGKDIIIVTSGAIGSGCSELGIKEKLRDINMRQVAAAVGQSSLIESYKKIFSKYNLKVAQILLTYEAFSNRKIYLNLRNSINTLLKLDIIPVINENDPISPHEIATTFGDNDKLSVLVASKMEADLLVMLTDVDGLYDKNPQNNKDAKLIKTVDKIDSKIERIAGQTKSLRGLGGMRTKIDAAKVAMNSGCGMVIVNGRIKNVLVNLIKGKDIGTIFISENKLSNKQRWILYAKSEGKIIVDAGAKKALLNKKSLLASGIKNIEGNFKSKDIVEINDFAKGLSNYSSRDLKKIKGKKSDQIKKILKKDAKEVILREDMVFS